MCVRGALDDEAKDRGFSVYLVDRVAPMLPPQLSQTSAASKRERIVTPSRSMRTWMAKGGSGDIGS